MAVLAPCAPNQVFRLVTRGSYEAELVHSANRKLGLEQAMNAPPAGPQGVEPRGVGGSNGAGGDAEGGGDGEAPAAAGGNANGPPRDRVAVERMLRCGAQNIALEDDSAFRRFSEADIEVCRPEWLEASPRPNALVPYPRFSALVPYPRFPALVPYPRFPALVPYPRFSALVPYPRFPALVPYPRFPALVPYPRFRPTRRRSPILLTEPPRPPLAGAPRVRFVNEYGPRERRRREQLRQGRPRRTQLTPPSPRRHVAARARNHLARPRRSAQVAFVADGEQIDVSDPDFWKKLLPPGSTEGNGHEGSAADEDELRPRRRAQKDPNESYVDGGESDDDKGGRAHPSVPTPSDRLPSLHGF